MSESEAATAAYSHLAYSQSDLQQVMREHYAKIIACLSGCYPHPLNVGWFHSPE